MRRRPDVFWRACGRGPVVVLLNGWSASGLAWPRAWVRALEQQARVVRIDNRGSGYSRFAETPFTMAQMAGDVAAVLDEEEVDRAAAVVGMSMGGMIAQEVAIRHGDRLDGLVLMATRPPVPAYFTPRDSSPWGLMSAPRRGEALDAFFTRLWSGATGEGFAEREPEAISELVEQIMARPTSRQALLHQLRAVNGWGRPQRLARITAPTVVLHGDADRLIHPENARRLADLIPGARLVSLPGVGHLPPVEAPDVVLREILGLALAGREREGAGVS